MLALIRSPYNRTPDAVYSVYHHVKAVFRSARWGGGYTFKPGFHSSVEDNVEHWPGNYSIREAINRQPPRTVGRAFDISPSDGDLRTLTRRLADAVARRDPRVACLREFYGTIDGHTVFGRLHLSPDDQWHPATADDTHLWHLHGSIFTPYADDWAALSGVASVLIGQSLADWIRDTGGTPPAKPPTTPDDGDDWERALIMTLPTVSDNSAPLGARKAVQSLLASRGYPPENTFDSRARPDGDFGPGSKSALGRYQGANGLEPDRKCGPKTWTKLLKG